MQVLVSDSSVLIELSKRELLDRIFELQVQFTVPDLLFEEELIDLGRYSRQDLIGFGLRVESLDPDRVTTAIAYQTHRPALSLVDCFALSLARQHGYTLLTEDRRMVNCALEEGIPRYGVLWIIDWMHGADVLTSGQVIAALDAMHADPRCPVPNQELARHLRYLRG